jgi:hypothetical protein
VRPHKLRAVKAIKVVRVKHVTPKPVKHQSGFTG